MSRTRETAAIAGLTLFAIVVRLVGLGADRSPTFHPALGSVLFVEQLLATRGMWGVLEHWRGTFASLQGLSLVDRSAIAFPVSAGLQAMLGPSLEITAIVGTVHDVIAVVLAWAVGRAYGGPRMGLLLAAFLAVSPVQIVWSRIGGLYIACVPHLLLGLWVGHAAGRRHSLALSLLAGTVAWLSVYNYYAARLVIPVALVALIGSARRVGVTWKTCLGLGIAFVAPLWLGYLTTSREPLAATFWPTVGGGFIPPPQRSVTSMGALALGRWQTHWLRSLELIFVSGRTMPAVPFGWSVASGGMLPLPTLILGTVGFLGALTRPARHAEWLALAVLGFLLAGLSGAEVRRLLAFDVAWSYFAAVALGGLLETRPGRRLVSARVAGLLLAAGFALGGVWSMEAIAALTRGETRDPAPIPFGAGALGEAVTCRSCLALAEQWRRDIASGDVVVLFDQDPKRDGVLFRTGLRGFGELAALDAGRPGYFVHACEEGPLRYPRPALPPCPIPGSPAFARLSARVAALPGLPARIRWYFTRPPAHEDLIARLRASGSQPGPTIDPRHLALVTDDFRMPP